MSLLHAKHSPKADPTGADPTLLWPSDWNAGHVFSGGSDGQMLTRSVAAPDGSAWTDVYARPAISVLDYGAVGDGVTNDGPAIQAAIADCPAGGTVDLPEVPVGYLVDTSFGATAAIAIATAMRVRIDGLVSMSWSGIQANPPALFSVSGDGVRFEGCGTLAGDGTLNDANTGTTATWPTLITVTGDRFTAEGLTFLNAPKAAITLASCWEARIAGCVFLGGPSTYSAPAYFGVCGDGGGRHQIVGNRWSASATDGRVVNACFFGGANGGIDDSVIAYNVVDRAHEKVCYLYGDRNLVVGNSITGAPNNSDAYRVSGNDNVVMGNVALNCMGLVQALNGAGNQILHNVGLGLTQAGIIIQQSSVLQPNALNGMAVIGNVLTAAAGGTTEDGIQLYEAAANTSEIRIQGNRVTGFGASSGRAAIHVFTPSASYAIARLSITGNQTTGGENGISCVRVSDSVIADNIVNGSTAEGILVNVGSNVDVCHNTIVSPGTYGVGVLNGATVRVRENAVSAPGNLGINGVTSAGGDAWGRGNTYTETALVGVVTLGATATNTVAHDGIAGNAVVLLQETNAAAAALAKDHGRPYVTHIVAGTSFDVVLPSGTPDGNETFSYEIVQ